MLPLEEYLVGGTSSSNAQSGRHPRRECSACPQERQQQGQAALARRPGCFWVQVGLCWFGLISAADLTGQEKCGLGVSGKVVSGKITWAGLIEAEFCCQHGGECFSYFNWNDFL